MIFLFRSGTVREKVNLVFRATRRHALNLAKFATVYKLVMFLLPLTRSGVPFLSSSSSSSSSQHHDLTVSNKTSREHPADALVAGCLGGYLVFGQRARRTGGIPSVNMQIVIYVFARAVLALAKLAVKPGHGLPYVSDEARSKAISHYAWPAFAAGSWGMVMWLFRWYPAELQGSLRSSMVYIYRDSNQWDSLRNFIWHNK